MKYLKIYEAYTRKPILYGELDFSGHNLKTLPKIPSGITVLNINSNHLKTISYLPEGLEELHCGFNDLTSISNLPKSLKVLNCSSNQLTSLPELPEGLKILYCDQNMIKILPEFNKNLETMVCEDNPLECLIPGRFINNQSSWWYSDKYEPSLNTEHVQRSILTRTPEKLSELEKRSGGILPIIKEEFPHLFTGHELNLLD